jgi:hypothetical protein
VSGLVRAGLGLALLVGGGRELHADSPHRVHAATTPPGAELVRTIPIGKPRRAVPRAVLSLSPSRLGALTPGATLHVYAEVQVSLTCIEPGLPRCIGRSYAFSPWITGRVVLAPGTDAAARSASLALGRPQGVRCRAQPTADRNHHCVLVFDETAEIPPAASLPCPPDACYVNLVVRASSRRAVRGNRLVIGADESSGGVSGNKGRLAAVVLSPGAAPSVWRQRTTHVRHDELPERQDGGRRVVYSVRLPTLRQGDVIAATAGQSTHIGHLPYAAYVSDQLVLARRARAVRPARPSPAADGGHLTAANGFNCTHGPSAYRTPCVATKAGALEVVRPPSGGAYYLNLVSRSKPKHAPGEPGDFARVLRRGFLDVTRYR